MRKSSVFGNAFGIVLMVGLLGGPGLENVFDLAFGPASVGAYFVIALVIATTAQLKQSGLLAPGALKDEIAGRLSSLQAALLIGRKGPPKDPSLMWSSDAPQLKLIASDVPAPRGNCPRCRDVVLEEGRCPRCNGALWDAADVLVFARERLHFERVDDLREFASAQPDASFTCPGYHSVMKAIRLKGVAVELCWGCGGLWTEGTERAAIVRRTEPPDTP